MYQYILRYTPQNARWEQVDVDQLDEDYEAGTLSRDSYFKQMAERMDQLRQRLEMDGSPPCAIELGMRLLEVAQKPFDRTYSSEPFFESKSLLAMKIPVMGTHFGEKIEGNTPAAAEARDGWESAVCHRAWHAPP